MSQFGTSIGLAIVGIIADSFTQSSGYKDKESPGALMEGYRAAFWVTFILTIVICPVAVFGLRSARADR